MNTPPDIRWILLGLGLVLIVGIWWWGARRAGHRGRPEPRDPTLSPPDDSAATGSAATYDSRAGAAETREWGVPPFEPLSIRTAEFEQVPVMDLPVMTSADMLEATLPPDVLAETAGGPPEWPDVEERVDAKERMSAQEHADAGPAAGSREMQRIVTLRVCASGDTRWPGAAVLSAFEQHGLTHGRYQVFHRRHDDGSTLLCAASLVEPGVFDPARMPEESYRGLTLFAVLPGPLPPMQMLDVLFATAQDLAQSLRGEVQDAKGERLSAAGAAALREDAARFQALLT